MGVQILVGDCIDRLRDLGDESVHCVVTSPPYWGLRDYGVDGQLGLEPSLAEHIDTMVAVFDEVRRVLRSDGTIWLNYGDSYAARVNGRSAADTKGAGNDDRTFRDKPFSTVGPIDPEYEPGKPFGPDGCKRRSGSLRGAPAGGVLKPKDLCMIPNRMAIALQDAGWWVRSEIIWHKPNPMPESCRDRPTQSHEKIFLLSKSPKYFYDADAIREESTYPDGPNAPDKIKSPYGQGFSRDTRVRKAHDPRHASGGHDHTNLHNVPRGECRNCRNVWTIATKPFSEAHFATFPPELARRCILAGCPEGGTVLDPFGGAGTTGLVADRLQRKAILIELNPEYAEMAKRRIEGDAPLFTEVAA